MSAEQVSGASPSLSGTPRARTNSQIMATVEDIAQPPQPTEQEFMESIQNLMSQLSESCRVEFETAMSSQDMNLLTPACKTEVSQVASATNQFEQAKEEGFKAAADDMMRKNGPQPNPNTKYYVFSTLVLFFLLVVAYIMWVNKQLKEAGLLDRKRKLPSKKKLEKQKAKKAN